MPRCTACRRLTSTPRAAPAGHVVLLVERSVRLREGDPVCSWCPTTPRPSAPPPLVSQAELERTVEHVRRSLGAVG